MLSVMDDVFAHDDDEKITKITGTITFSDGQTVEFLLGNEGSSRWGNTRDVAARAVLPCDEMLQALVSEGVWADE